jgi:putative membrane protein
MTYVVNGLREAITGGVEARYWMSVAVLATIFAATACRDVHRVFP